jgi:hypothetical protein
MFAGLWIVADMDGTLVSTPSKAHGHYLPLTSSPCLPPLLRFIAGGGSLCVVSTAGKRMWRQVFEALHSAYHPFLSGGVPSGRLLLGGFSGAALHVGDLSSGLLREELAYRDTALAGSSTVLPPEHAADIQTIVRGAMLTSFARMRSDEGYLSLLSRKYHEPMKRLLSEIYDQRGETVHSTPMLDMEALTAYGKYLRETNDALLDLQKIPSASGDEVLAQVTALGIPMAKAHELFDDAVVEQLASLGARVKFQPNSVCVSREGLDKATCVAYLVQHYGLELRKALAFGDVPGSIDKPLTEFPPMRFVSVSLTPDDDPPNLISVGGEEGGTAAFLNEWLDLVDINSTAENLFDAAIVNAAADRARSLVLGTSKM